MSQEERLWIIYHQLRTEEQCHSLSLPGQLAVPPCGVACSGGKKGCEGDVLRVVRRSGRWHDGNWVGAVGRGENWVRAIHWPPWDEITGGGRVPSTLPTAENPRSWPTPTSCSLGREGAPFVREGQGIPSNWGCHCPDRRCFPGS